MKRKFILPLVLVATLAFGACSVEVSGGSDRTSGGSTSEDPAANQPSDTSNISIDQVEAPLAHSKTSEIVE